jgi:hypothetical protein
MTQHWKVIWIGGPDDEYLGDEAPRQDPSRVRQKLCTRYFKGALEASRFAIRTLQGRGRVVGLSTRTGLPLASCERSDVILPGTFTGDEAGADA